MKARPAEPYAALSGRTTRRSNTYTRTNRHTGKVEVVQRDNYDVEWSHAQQEHRRVIGSRSRLASQWWQANRPTPSLPLGTPLYQALLARWKSDHRYPSAWALLLHLIQPDGTVPIND